MITQDGTPKDHIETSRNESVKSNDSNGIKSKDSPDSRSLKKSDDSVENGSSPPQNRFSSRGDTRGTKQNIWKEVLTKYTYSKRFANGRELRRNSVWRTQHDSETEDNAMGVGKKEVRNCFVKYFDLIEMLQPVLMQDGPFFILRVVFWFHYNVFTNMTFLLCGKNLLVVVVQVYRIMLMYCKPPKKEDELHELDEASNRVQFAVDSNRRLSNKNHMGSRQEYLAARVWDAL